MKDIAARAGAVSLVVVLLVVIALVALAPYLLIGGAIVWVAPRLTAAPADDPRPRAVVWVPTNAEIPAVLGQSAEAYHAAPHPMPASDAGPCRWGLWNDMEQRCELDVELACGPGFDRPTVLIVRLSDGARSWTAAEVALAPELCATRAP